MCTIYRNYWSNKSIEERLFNWGEKADLLLYLLADSSTPVHTDSAAFQL